MDNLLPSHGAGSADMPAPHLPGGPFGQGLPARAGGPYSPHHPHPPYFGAPVVPPQYPPHVVVVQGHKNAFLAALLGFFFGPLGMLYATVTGAVVMFVVNLLVAVVTFGFGLALSWPVCALWAAIAASNHNSKLAAIGVRRF